MASYNYADAPNSNLICCICRMPFIDPTTTRTCFHTFCRDCIIRAIAHVPQCPVDRSPLEVDDLTPANPIVRALVDELLVECPYRSSGCTITCQRQLLTTHLKDDCSYTAASGSGHESNQNHQGQQDVRTSAEQKDPEVTGTFSPPSLPVGTSSTEPTVACPEVIVPCPHFTNGCQWSGSHQHLSSTHLASCPYESIKDFFSLSNSRLSSLTAENILLKHKVDALEGIVQTMKCEMQAVKIALGPWYRPDTANRSSVLATSDIPSITTTRSNPSRRFSTQDSVTSIPTEAPIIPAANTGPGILASYFPPVASPPPPPPQFDQQHVRDMRARHRHSASIAHFMDLAAGYPHHSSMHHINFARPIPQNHNTIVPLNLGTTLEGYLESIRESIITLSASFDSVARQQDLALTNETLKNEEMMSLKASIHGLRMQLHNIMMDRNAQVANRLNESLFWGDGRGPADNGGWPNNIPPRPHAHLSHSSISTTKL